MCTRSLQALNAADGADYRRAYLHFRRDHKMPQNIFYHCLCLVFQLSANYSLLATLDAKLFPGTGPLAAASTLGWLYTLLARSSGAPMLVKLLVCARAPRPRDHAPRSRRPAPPCSSATPSATRSPGDGTCGLCS